MLGDWFYAASPRYGTLSTGVSVFAGGVLLPQRARSEYQAGVESTRVASSGCEGERFPASARSVQYAPDLVCRSPAGRALHLARIAL